MIQDGPLDALAASLVKPAKCGIYLSKSEVIVLANISEGSLRVNERKRMLADVLKSPDNVTDLAKLVQLLIDFSEAHVQRYDELQENFPSLSESLAPWRKSALKTIEHLVEVKEEILES